MQAEGEGTEDTLSFDEIDEIINPPPAQTDFGRVALAAVSRRSMLRGSIAFGASAFVSAAVRLAAPAAEAASRLRFDAVAANTTDTVTLPPGYSWHVVAKWGEPLWSDAPEFDPASRGTSQSQQKAFGDNNDGMAILTRAGRHVLAVNNEFSNQRVIFGNRPSGKPETPDDINKGKMAHGISILAIAREGRVWSIVKDAPENRRITPDTAIEITGPARGHALLKTDADSTGAHVLGTFNNCGNGITPWGTYLACEENFNGYFASSDAGFEPTAAMKRYGVKHKGYGYLWETVDERFDISRHPNEPNRFGYVVEIDPFDPASTPKKRTALGRFKHENAELVLTGDGRVAVYMGDDEKGEYFYRFISRDKFVADGDNSRLLDSGRLQVARFDEDLRGEWLDLTPETTGIASEQEICINTRLAASAVKATTMDRPEWVAANPHGPEIFLSLTNNDERGIKPNKGGDETPVGGPNPRAENLYGQIVRLTPDNADHASPRFSWDLFVTAGNPTVHSDANAGSANVTADNMFNSPDGLAFDSTGLLYIQTDGKTSNEGMFKGMGNNQMLVGDPATGEIKRFLVAPREAEVTGITWSPDRSTLFVGIQHPGGRKISSTFPDGGVPRSCVIGITRDDGGLIG